MDIEKIDLTFNDIANKLLSGALSPDTRNRFYNLVNLDLLKLKAGLPEDYRPGQPLSAQGHQITFKISDDIRFLIKTVDVNKSANGYFPYPIDYAAYDYVLLGYIENDCGETKIRWKAIEAVTGIERAIRLDSHLIPPTMEKPIISYNMLGWQVDPEEVMQIRLNYLRLPKTPYRDYTMVGDQDVFKPVGVGSLSVDAEWAEPMFGDFVIRVCRYAGITLSQEELVQFALQRQLQGQ